VGGERQREPCPSSLPFVTEFQISCPKNRTHNFYNNKKKREEQKVNVLFST